MATKTRPRKKADGTSFDAAPATAAEQVEEPAVAQEADVDITIAAEPTPRLTVSLVGRTYRIRKPKTALLMKMALTAKNSNKGGKKQDPEALYHLMSEVLEKAFGKKMAAEIQGRLEDSDDDLEYEHITALVTAIMSHGTGNPSTSS